MSKPCLKVTPGWDARVAEGARSTGESLETAGQPAMATAVGILARAFDERAPEQDFPVETAGRSSGKGGKAGYRARFAGQAEVERFLPEREPAARRRKAPGCRTTLYGPEYKT